MTVHQHFAGRLADDTNRERTLTRRQRNGSRGAAEHVRKTSGSIPRNQRGNRQDLSIRDFVRSKCQLYFIAG